MFLKFDSVDTVKGASKMKDKRKDGKKWKRQRQVVEGAVEPEEATAQFYERKTKQPAHITKLWAIERMADHVNYELEKLITEQLISVDDKEDYMNQINMKISERVKDYDVNVKGKKSGRSASAVHFFTVVVDNAIKNIRRGIDRYNKNLKMVPISQLPPVEAKKFGYVSAEDSLLGDGGKSVATLEWDMDLNTLRGMFTPLEAWVFDRCMDEIPHTQIAEEMGISESWFRHGILKKIREKCIKCGFTPHKMKSGNGK